jgi:hypothetical protein
VLLMKQDEVSSVVEIGLLSFATGMPQANGLAHAIEKPVGLALPTLLASLHFTQAASVNPLHLNC